MLNQFTVKNFRSFADETTLNMQASSSSEHKESVLIDKGGSRFLPLAAIYGPNGGGKSNALKAIAALATKVLRPIGASSVEQEKNRSAQFLTQAEILPFLFSDQLKNNPTEFTLFFSTDLAEYRYELHVRDEKVLLEQLERIKFDTNRRSMLFFRSGNTIRMKGDFRGLKYRQDISEGLPLLSYLGIVYRDNPIVNDIISWFSEGILFLDYNIPWQDRLLVFDDKHRAKTALMDFFREMDIDIIDYRIQEKDNGGIEIFTVHEVDGKRTELRIEEESSGTQKLFSLLQFVLFALVNGSTLIADEMDAKIHPKLLRYIIEKFSDPETNRKSAQLIFTSHDMYTMSKDVFRRDEIWFVAKTRRQSSHLYSLADFRGENGSSPRPASSFNQQYLKGRYGADPYLQRIINWGDLYGET